MSGILAWLQRIENDPVLLAGVAFAGFALIALLLLLRSGLRKATTALFTVRSTRKDEKSAIERAWADESDLVAFGLLKKQPTWTERTRAWVRRH